MTGSTNEISTPVQSRLMMEEAVREKQAKERERKREGPAKPAPPLLSLPKRTKG